MARAIVLQAQGLERNRKFRKVLRAALQSFAAFNLCGEVDDGLL
jgi:hypothetical protein